MSYVAPEVSSSRRTETVCAWVVRWLSIASMACCSVMPEMSTPSDVGVRGHDVVGRMVAREGDADDAAQRHDCDEREDEEGLYRGAQMHGAAAFGASVA